MVTCHSYEASLAAAYHFLYGVAADLSYLSVYDTREFIAKHDILEVLRVHSWGIEP